MDNKKYNVIYSEKFIKQLSNILYYFKYILKNKIAAENFYKEVIDSIEKRRQYPTSFEVFKKTKEKGVNWYRIQIKNYTIFYVVKNDIMEVRRIYYSKRNFKKLI